MYKVISIYNTKTPMYQVISIYNTKTPMYQVSSIYDTKYPCIKLVLYMTLNTHVSSYFYI